jgi:adenosylcobinamide amidohydrolase
MDAERMATGIGRSGPGLRLARPWLVLDLGAPHRVTSWALNRPGRVRASRIAWREVRDADLTEELDAAAWLSGELDAAGLADAVAFVTSRDVSRHVAAKAEAEGIRAVALATVGLSNAERVGARLGPAGAAGTINLALRLSGPLGEGAALEALSLAAAARTAAVMEHGPALATGRATGTGTDCIALAAPEAGAPLAHAGMHTAAGEALGRAAYEAVARGVRDWMAEMGRAP